MLSNQILASPSVVFVWEPEWTKAMIEADKKKGTLETGFFFMYHQDPSFLYSLHLPVPGAAEHLFSHTHFFTGNPLRSLPMALSQGVFLCHQPPTSPHPRSSFAFSKDTIFLSSSYKYYI